MGEIYVSLAEFAKEVGVSRAAISQSIKRCQERDEPLRIKLVDINGKQKVAFLESKKLWEESSNIITNDEPLKKSTEKKHVEKKESISNIKPTTADAFDEEIHLEHPDQYQMSEIKKYKEYFLAKRQQVALLKSKGKLIDRDVVGRLMPALLSSFSDKLRYIPEATSFVIASKIKDAYDVNVDEDELSLLVKNAMHEYLKSTIEYLKDNINLELEES